MIQSENLTNLSVSETLVTKTGLERLRESSGAWLRTCASSEGWSFSSKIAEDTAVQEWFTYSFHD